MSLVLAHISDLHVSRFGEHVSSLRSRRAHGRFVRRGRSWEPVTVIDGWTIERRNHDLRLVDDAGAEHVRRRIDAGGAAAVERALCGVVQERMRTAHHRLAASLPSEQELDRLLADDPTNTNLRFCRAALALRQDAPDYIVVTGDITDDGVGYDLVLAALAPFVERGRVLAVPGNHDVYDSPLFVVPAHARKRRSEKLVEWRRFARALGLAEEGVWLRDLGEGVVLCGIDSCTPARTPMSASGAVSHDTIVELRRGVSALPRETCRIAALHHHVVNPPLGAVGAAPWQLGLRLRNARVVYELLRELDFRCVLNGHRHLGYRYHPSHAPLFVSAPSATLGCRSSSEPQPFYWRLELREREVVSVRERML
jgi:3',5'-cyclic AMP phosphodiesterase CpdA